MDCHPEHWTESGTAFGAVTGQWIDGPNGNQYAEHWAEIDIQSFVQQSIYRALGNIRTSEALTMLCNRIGIHNSWLKSTLRALGINQHTELTETLGNIRTSEAITSLDSNCRIHQRTSQTCHHAAYLDNGIHDQPFANC